MGSSEDMCLRWTDHHSIFFNAAEELCQNQNLTDVILSCGGKIFNAHKLVLSICSKYFANLFSNKNILGHSTVIHLKNVDPYHMELLLSFMYRGEMRTQEDVLSDLLDTARDLQIKGLQDDSSPSEDNNRDFSHVPEPPVVPPPLHNDFKPMPSKKARIDQPESENKLLNPCTLKRSRVSQSVPIQTHGLVEDFRANEYESVPKAILEEQPQSLDLKEEISVENSESDNAQIEFIDVYSDYRDNKGNYFCDICNKSFRGATDLKNHLPVHTGERPHVCENCNRSFTQIGSLNRHKKKHCLMQTSQISN